MHDRMMRTGKRFAVYLAAAVIMTCCLAQTIDCYRLRKKERQEGRKGSDSTKVTDVEEGRIVFGRVFKKATGLDAPVIDDTKKPSNASSEDEASYQADFPGWPGDQLQHLNSREAAWKRMSPSLMCGGDQLKFSAEGRGASQFAVDKGNEPPIPLSQVPPSCGYGMQKNSLGLVLLVPYDGCNIIVEDGCYVLPLRWHGIPVSLLCHKPAAPQKPQPHTPWYSPSNPVVSPHVVPQPNVQKPPPHVMYPQLYPQMPAPHVIPPGMPAPHVIPPGMPAPHVMHPQMVPPHLIYPQPEGMPPLKKEVVPLTLGLDTPLTQKDVPQVPLEMPLIPRMRSDQNESPPKIPQSYYFLPDPNYPSVPEPAKAPIATTAEKPERPKRPLYPPFYHPYSHFPHPVPVTTSAPTAKPAATAPPMFPFPIYPPFPRSGLGPPQATAKPTLPATRPQPQYFPFPPQNPFLHPYQYSAPKPETTMTRPQFAYMPFPSPYQMVAPYPATKN
uniref:Uncharacterized protein n=1 Tax=Gasterosteus aculeatus aculeatus TaxID=481459 RepID=A0AAQ4Q1R8_GASAC|nr:vegetative cell wall protein gp1-like [Gasterosteus aculeatus aculeatus]